jgi:hypothetical protein
MTTLRYYSCAAVMLMSAVTLQASPILSLQPSGTISGTPGSTIGWGFTLTADPLYAVSIIGTFLTGETNPALGSYSDFISFSGGPSLGVLDPGSPAWTQSFES